MFDVSFSELLVIGAVALVVLGPERLPEVARTAGRWVGKLRRFVENVRADVDRELQGEGLAELRRLKEELEQTRAMVEQSSARMLEQAREHLGEERPALPPAAGVEGEVPTVKKKAARKPRKRAARKSAAALKPTGPHGQAIDEKKD